MPAKFERCLAAGGKVRTIKPKGPCHPVFLKVCKAPGSRKTVSGEVGYASRLPRGCGKRRGR